MAQYSHLLIYVKVFNFSKIVYRLIHNFKKEYKYTLGAELQQIILQVLDGIIETNSVLNNKKIEKIEEVSLLFDRFKIRIRLAYELGQISKSKYFFIQKEIEEIGKMIGGWQKYINKDNLTKNI